MYLSIGGFFKHFEGFFKSFKKKVKSNKPDPPKTEINLSTAVKSIIQDTTTKTTIIGARYFQRSKILFVQQKYWQIVSY